MNRLEAYLNRPCLIPIDDDTLIDFNKLNNCIKGKILKWFQVPNKMLIIADGYLHINLQKLKDLFMLKSYKLWISRAYKGRDGLMRYEFIYEHDLNWQKIKVI